MTIALWLERLKGPCLNGLVVGLGLEDDTGRKNFSLSSWCHCLRRFDGRDDQDAALPLRPLLGDHQSGFDRLAETDFVGQQRALESGEKANSAASTWCGLRSTCAPATAPASFSALSGAHGWSARGRSTLHGSQ